MAFSNEIKTILKIDGKDWEKSIKSISEAEKSYFKESTENIDKLINSKEELAKIEAEHRKKIITLNKEIKESEKQLAKDISSNNEEKIKQTKELIDSKKKDLDISIKSIDQKRAEVKNTQITIEQINRYKKLLDETKNSLQQLHGQESKRQSTQEKDIANMKEQYKNTYELTSAQVKYNEAKKRLDGMLTSGSISQDQYNKGLATEGKLLKENKGSYETATNAVVRHLRQVETLIVSYYMLKGAWDATIGVGINVNRTIESNTQGIAALITANTRMTTSTGQAVTNQQKFAMSQSIAAETMKKIKTAAIDTAGTFEDLIMIFQQATGQTLSMGNSMGGSIKEIIDNTIQLSKRMANIAGAIGMPLDRVREEVRSLLSGNASTDSLISTMLFGSPSQANQAMEKAKASGKDGVKKLLDEMLAPFDVLEGLMTYDIQFNRMKDAYQSLAATTTKPIFDGLTKSFASVANYLTPQKIDAIANGFEDVGNAVATIVPPLVQVATYLALVKGGMLVWKNALPLIESATIGIVDFARGTIDAEIGLNKTGTAFGRLNETFKKNAPMLAIIAAYEAYNFLIGDTLDKEKRLHEATSLKLEDIKKLSLAQAQTGLADINVGLSEMIKERDAIGKQIMSGTFGKQNAVGEWTDFGKLSKEEIFRLQSQQDTIQAQIDSMYKTKELYVAAVNVASGIQTTAKAFGELMTEGSASKTLIGLLDKYKAPLTQAQALQSQIKELQHSIKLTEKESKDKTLDTKSKNMKLQLVSEGEKRVQALQKELAEINKKESNKASSILNTEEKKEYNLDILRLEEKLAADKLKIKLDLFNQETKLDANKYDEVQKTELMIFDAKYRNLQLEKEKAESISNTQAKEAEYARINKEHSSLQIEKLEYITKSTKDYNDEVQKGIDLEQKRIEKADTDALKSGKFQFDVITHNVDTDSVSQLENDLVKLTDAYNKTMWNMETVSGEAADKLYYDYNENIKKIKNELESIKDIEFKFKIDGLEDIINQIGRVKFDDSNLDEYAKATVGMSSATIDFLQLQVKSAKLTEEKSKIDKDYEKDKLKYAGKNEKIAEVEARYTAKNIQITNDKQSFELQGYLALANAASAYFEAGTTGAKAMQLVTATLTYSMNAMAIANAAASITAAGIGDPYTAPARVANMIALMTSVLATFGVIGSPAGGGGVSAEVSMVQEDENNYKASQDLVVGRLDRQIQLLENIDRNGSAQAAGITVSKTTFDRTVKELSYAVAQDVVTAERTDQARREAVAFLINEVAKSGINIGGVVGKTGSVSAAYLNTTGLAGDTDNALKYIAILYDNIEKINFNLIDRFDKADVYKWVDEAQEALSSYANSMVDIVGEMQSASSTMQDAYDTITGTTTYETLRLKKAYDDFDSIRGNLSYADYLKSQIDAIKSVEDSFGDDIVSLLLSSDLNDFSKQVDALETLSKATGKVFEGGVEDAINYLDSIELVAEAQAKSIDAQKDLLDSIKDLSDGFTSMTDSIQETIDKLLGIESGNSQEQMIRDFWTRKDEADKLLSKGGDLTETELSTLSNIINQINSLSTNIQSSQAGDVSGITSSLVNELLGIKKDVSLNQGLVNSIYTSNGGTLSATGEQGLLTQFLSSLPSFDVGTPYLANDTLAQVHKREMIIDPQSSDVLRKYGIKVDTSFLDRVPANNLTSNQSQGIIQAINNMASRLDKIEQNTKKSATVLDEAQYGQRTLKVEMAS